MSDHLDRLIRDWARVGGAFGVEPAAQTPDLERLVLRTAHHAPEMARLFILGATWLHRYADLIARHRLTRLMLTELAPEHRPALGLLLDLAHQKTHPLEFQSIIRHLRPHPAPHPLFEVQRANAQLVARAERRASPISKRWGLWCEEFPWKDDALRSAPWIMAQNPGFITRADFRGDLRASVLASLEFDAGAPASELAMARCAGGSRAQVRSALANLELSGRVQRVRPSDSNRKKIEIRFVDAA